jgi:hypothetical protein
MRRGAEHRVDKARGHRETRDEVFRNQARLASARIRACADSDTRK